MRQAKLKPDVVSYNSGISACGKGEQWHRALALLSAVSEAKLELDIIYHTSLGPAACEKGEQWQPALALLSEMRKAKLVPDVISYSATISACEKGDQWQPALALLSEMRKAKLKPNHWSLLQRWNQRVREGRAVAAGAGAAQRDAWGEAGAQRHLSYMRWGQRVQEGRAVAVGAGAAQRDAEGEVAAQCHLLLQRWNQRVREGRAVAVGAGAAQRDAGGEAGAQFSYNAGISACGKGEWQPALALLTDMREAMLEPDVISSATAVGPARAERASSGRGRWSCWTRCGRRSWSPT
ncbi:unnamed protein product [Prorocentrum cordatum]|uniref:Pentatricopeptide repeat-containing protein, chloroplastic n=1 Tax=Prorocentrum cordatum TaxID=2364126 RepID=A0ABN9UFG8_9DINO|nr:unnamed protein product [Polarella glacialis]